jgi:4-hydroxybenzoate polyprenyltransferase
MKTSTLNQAETVFIIFGVCTFIVIAFLMVATFLKVEIDLAMKEAGKWVLVNPEVFAIMGLCLFGRIIYKKIKRIHFGSETEFEQDSDIIIHNED